MTSADNEKLCMADGCDKEATRFEGRPMHWHDFVWCEEHAKPFATVPLNAEPAPPPKEGP